VNRGFPKKERIFASFDDFNKAAEDGVGITFTPVARINSLWLSVPFLNIFEKVEAWLRETRQDACGRTKLEASLLLLCPELGRQKISPTS